MSMRAVFALETSLRSLTSGSAAAAEAVFVALAVVAAAAFFSPSTSSIATSASPDDELPSRMVSGTFRDCSLGTF